MDLPKLLFFGLGAAVLGTWIWSVVRTIRIERDWRRPRASNERHSAAGDLTSTDTDSLDSGYDSGYDSGGGDS